jgi:hypothetical protein
VATRYYFPSSGAAAVSPAISAEWDIQTGVDRLALVTTRISSAMADKTTAKGASNQTGQDVIWRQYVSDPIGAQTISGTVKGQIRARENASAANYRMQVLVSVVSGDGATLRGVAYAGDPESITTSPTSEFPLSSVANIGTSRQAPRGASQTLTDVTASSGDRIVIEVGYRINATVTTASTGTGIFGDNNASDLPEDETTTTALNPWIEFSNTIAPVSTGPITVSGSDSVTASTSEAGALSATLTGTDSSTVSLTESGSVTSLATIAGSDTLTTSTTEQAGIAGTVSGADAVMVDAAALASSSTALAGSDTMTVSTVALPTATATLSGADSPTVSATAVSDVSTITTASSSDTVTVSTTETALVAVGLTSADTVTVGTSETSTASATLTAADAPTVSTTAQPAIAASLQGYDAATVSTAATSGMGVADNPTVSLTETRSIAATLSQSQTLTITLVETPGVATTIPATDSATVSLSATGSVQTITLPNVPRVTNVLNRSGAYAVQIVLWRADRYGNRSERVPVSIPIQGALDYNEDRDVKRKLSLTVNSPHYFTPFSDFVIPEITLTDASGTRTTRQMGHYLVTPPNTSLTPGRFSGSLEAQDVTFLLQRDTLPFALNFFTGLDPGAGARRVAIDGGFAPSQLVLPDTGFNLTTAMHFDAGTSRLKVINDLYNAANWYAVWMDGDGLIRTTPYQNLQTASPKQTYSTQGDNVQLIPPIGEQPDWSRLRNRVTVRSISPSKPTIFGMAEIVNPNHPLHRDRIGMVLADTIEDSQVTSNADADAKAALLLSTSASYYRKLAIETVIDLDAGAHDIIGLDVRHREVTYDGTWFRRAWTMQLKGVTARTSSEVFRIEAYL